MDNEPTKKSPTWVESAVSDINNFFSKTLKLHFDREANPKPVQAQGADKELPKDSNVDTQFSEEQRNRLKDTINVALPKILEGIKAAAAPTLGEITARRYGFGASVMSADEKPSTSTEQTPAPSSKPPTLQM